MRLGLLLSIVSMTLCGLAPQAGAQAPATRPAEAKAPAPAKPVIADANLRRQIEAMRKSVQSMPAGPKVKLADLVKMTLDQDTLRVEVAKIEPTAQQVRLDVTDADGIWTLHCQAQGAQRYINLTRYDFDAAASGGPWTIALNAQPNNVNFSARFGMGYVNFVQSGANSVQFFSQNPQQNHAARNIGQLARERPEAARQFVRPMLAAFGGSGLLRPGATEIYRVFSEISADPDLVARLQNHIIPQLDAPIFAERQAADEAIAKLGRDGVLAVLRIDRDQLSGEQRNRLHLFVASHEKLKIVDPAAARKDPDFLIDCLSDDDHRVRQAALDALSAIAGKALDFDLKLSQPEAAAAAERLRTLLPRPEAP